MLYKKGLAYQAEALVNYDPVDKTVLANEQVDSNGRSWRSGAVVQQINLRQWFFRITAFKEALLEDLNTLSENGKWPERVVSQQRNWLGRSQGARFKFKINGCSIDATSVFTTRPDTLHGVQYLALSLSHPIVQGLAATSSELKTFLNKKSSFAPDSKAGFELPIFATSPLGTDPLPIFAAPYVLENYGEGAVMGVPAHDARDLAFWKQHKPNAPVAIVVAPKSKEAGVVLPLAHEVDQAYSGPGVLTSLCGTYSGMNNVEAATKIVNDLRSRDKVLAERVETWRLRDWLVSRQRYWGTPIPIIHCKTCGPIPVPDHDLPVELPKLDDSIKGQTGNPLENMEDWVNVKCPECGSNSRRETDTMDTFVDSSWYFARFPDAHNKLQPFSPESATRALPVDTYIGGVEHAILHLLYARFMYKFLCGEGVINTDQLSREPFTQLIAQGMVHGKTFSDPETGRFLLPHEVDLSTSIPTAKGSDKAANISWEKMSKSKHNGVDPSTCITKYGADATRAHILFAAPVSEVLQWDEEKITGIQRWFQRVQRILKDMNDMNPAHADQTQASASQSWPCLPAPSDMSDQDAEIFLLTQNTIRSVTHTLNHDIYGLNTVISDLTKLTNAIHGTGLVTLSPAVAYSAIKSLICMLAPIAPAFASHCWQELNCAEYDRNAPDVFASGWPQYTLTPETEAQLAGRKRLQTCAVQINGKLRFTVEVPVLDARTTPKETEERVLSAVLEAADAKTWLREKNDWEKRKRVVVVGGGKLVNVVF